MKDKTVLINKNNSINKKGLVTHKRIKKTTYFVFIWSKMH